MATSSKFLPTAGRLSGRGYALTRNLRKNSIGEAARRAYAFLPAMRKRGAIHNTLFYFVRLRDMSPRRRGRLIGVTRGNCSELSCGRSAEIAIRVTYPIHSYVSFPLHFAQHVGLSPAPVCTRFAKLKPIHLFTTFCQSCPWYLRLADQALAVHHITASVRGTQILRRAAEQDSLRRHQSDGRGLARTHGLPERWKRPRSTYVTGLVASENGMDAAAFSRRADFCAK